MKRLLGLLALIGAPITANAATTDFWEFEVTLVADKSRCETGGSCPLLDHIKHPTAVGQSYSGSLGIEQRDGQGDAVTTCSLGPIDCSAYIVPSYSSRSAGGSDQSKTLYVDELYEQFFTFNFSPTARVINFVTLYADNYLGVDAYPLQAWVDLNLEYRVDRLSYNGKVLYDVTPAPVPLPAGLPLMLTALGVAGLARRR